MMAAAPSENPKKSSKAASSKTKKAPASENQVLTYNGKPLARCGNMIYYGKPEDKYVAIFHRFKHSYQKENRVVTSKEKARKH